jgi:hypothetical protein
MSQRNEAYQNIFQLNEGAWCGYDCYGRVTCGAREQLVC